jgi:hypothetical protein
MAIDKFHEKNIAVLAKKETTSGTYLGGLVGSDAILATSIDGSVTTETNSVQFVGSSETRDKYSWVTDSKADFTLETLQQVLGTLNPALDATTLPLFDAYTACGANVAVDGGTGVVTITNAIKEVSTISLDMQKTSANNATEQKLYRFYGIRGLVDIDASVKEIPKLKFTFMGNALDPITTAIVTPNFGAQSTSIASPVRQATVVEAKITPYLENFSAQSTIVGVPTIAFVGNIATVTLASHGLVTGQRVNISGVTNVAPDASFYNGDHIVTVLTANTFSYVMNGTPAGVAAGTIVAKKDGYAKSFCFDKFTAPNFLGYKYDRVLLACEEGYDRAGEAPTATVTLVETFSPAFNIATITKAAHVATLTTDIPHGLTTGMSIKVQGATDPLYNGTFLVMSSATTTTLTYHMGGTPAANAVASSVGSFKLTNLSSATFDPDSNIQEFFSLKLKFGTRDGGYVTYNKTKVQLTNTKNTKVGVSMGKELTFDDTGNASIVLS